VHLMQYALLYLTQVELSAAGYTPARPDVHGQRAGGLRARPREEAALYAAVGERLGIPIPTSE